MMYRGMDRAQLDAAYNNSAAVHSAVQHGAGSGRCSVDVDSHSSLPRVRRQPVEPPAGAGRSAAANRNSAGRHPVFCE